jgi:formylglycine-generating enzyme required for sulfatase activity
MLKRKFPRPVPIILIFIFLLCMSGIWADNGRAASRAISVSAKTVSGNSTQIQLYSGYYALVVGCGEYRAGWPRLPNPVSDAREVAGALKSMGWSVKLLENPDGSTLMEALNRLVVEEGKKRDQAVLFWFSGHGHTLSEADGSKLGYLVPMDAPDPEKDECGFMNRAISMRQIETVAKRMEAKHVLMAFDSCFSGAIFQMARAKPSAYIQEKVKEPVRQFITAGDENEPVPDRSVFKEVFLQGISKQYADQNSDSYVTGEELGAYLQEQVVNYSKNAQHPQFGKINNPRLDKGDFVFAASGAAVVEGPLKALPDAKTAEAAKPTFEAEKMTADKKIKNSLGMEFVYIEPGTFIMGSPDSEPGRDNDEGQHKVTLTRGYYLQTTEVTVGQWREFARKSGYRTEAETGGGAFVWTGDKWEKKKGIYWDHPALPQDDSHPVNCVSWNDAQEFIDWLNEADGVKYRLPSEAEWEYAALAGNTTTFAKGAITERKCNEAPNLAAMGWYCANSGGNTHPVAQKKPNAWGLYDMHGNIAEWCQDWYKNYSAASATDPKGPSTGTIRVIRGGSWFNNVKYCRSADRGKDVPAGRNYALGLRMARNP